MAKRNRRPSGRSPGSPSKGRLRTALIVVTLVAGVGLVFALRLAQPGGPTPPEEAPPAHEHPPGPHGGHVVAIDKENRLHAEAVLGPRGVVRLYTFGEQLTVPRPAVARVVCAAVREHGGKEELPVMLRPEPLATDPPSTTSRFVARLPSGRPSGDAELIVRSMSFGPDRFQFVVPLPPSPRDTDAERAEAALYAEPGGRYTAADIQANGKLAAARKFSGERPRHDEPPTTGERICPVSRARADARFTWVVGGNEYQFCCPPCIDEFVATAKERPNEIREPDLYRQP